MKRFDAREAVVEALKVKGLYVETTDNKMTLPICNRSGDVVEPMLKPQWYVNCQGMAKEAIEAVREGQLTILPKTSEKEWFTWLENIQDWCISRQLWWGHSIPAYFIKIAGQNNDASDGSYWVSARSEEAAMEKANKRFPKVSPANISLEKDPDVLDTWFSAALWPFAIFGWPEKVTLP
jgi:valyl-tRNA synthetase